MADKPIKGRRSGPEEQRLQGHWLLAKMGKKVLRPGGIEMTHELLRITKPAATDRIVEFGPGVGRTAQMLLEVNPQEYTAVDPNPEGTAQLKKILAAKKQAKLVVADAAKTGLPDGCADLVIGEAMLTMQSQSQKATIVAEAARILAPGGRYAIHELGFHPDDLDPKIISQVEKGMSRSIKVGARPLTGAEWSKLLEEAGLKVIAIHTTPMHLLEPKRLIADEGLGGALKFFFNVLRNPAARKRILGMKATFRENAKYINAIGVVAIKPQ